MRAPEYRKPVVGVLTNVVGVLTNVVGVLAKCVRRY